MSSETNLEFSTICGTIVLNDCSLKVYSKTIAMLYAILNNLQLHFFVLFGMELVIEFLSYQAPLMPK